MRFLNNLKVSSKINVITVIAVVLLGVTISISYIKMGSLEKHYSATIERDKLLVDVLIASEQGLQVQSSLRGIIVDYSDTKAQEFFLKAVEDFDKAILRLKDSLKISPAYEKFEIEKLYTTQKMVLDTIIKKIKNGQPLTKEDNTKSTKEWRNLKKALLVWQDRNKVKSEEFATLFYQEIVSATWMIIGTLILTVIFIFIFIQIISRAIITQLTTFQSGLSSFFAFLNHETLKAEPIALNSNDEFGQMAKVVNENIKKTEKMILEDNEFIEDVKSVSSKIGKGCFGYDINATTSNPTLQELRDTMNSGIINLRKEIRANYPILDNYVKGDYTQKLNIDYFSPKGGVHTILEKTTLLVDTIIQMLTESQRNSKELDENSSTLSEHFERLNTISENSYSSLNRASEAISQMNESIVSTIDRTTQVSEQSNDIKSVIDIISDIAEQTNLLSLNAAIEAARAW